MVAARAAAAGDVTAARMMVAEEQPPTPRHARGAVHFHHSPAKSPLASSLAPRTSFHALDNSGAARSHGQRAFDGSPPVEADGPKRSPVRVAQAWAAPAMPESTRSSSGSNYARRHLDIDAEYDGDAVAQAMALAMQAREYPADEEEAADAAALATVAADLGAGRFAPPSSVPPQGASSRRSLLPSPRVAPPQLPLPASAPAPAPGGVPSDSGSLAPQPVQRPTPDTAKGPHEHAPRQSSPLTQPPVSAPPPAAAQQHQQRGPISAADRRLLAERLHTERKKLPAPAQQNQRRFAASGKGAAVPPRRG